MEPSGNSPVQHTRLHPLMATAAISVIVLSAVGVTAFLTNRSSATPSPVAAQVASLAAGPTAVVAPASLAAPLQAPLPAAPLEPAAPAVMPRIAAVDQVSRVGAPAVPDYQRPSDAAPATPRYQAPLVAQARPAVCRNCGVVDSIREIKVKGEGTGVGAVGGAVVGGLLGNMVGAGRGKALATVAGAVGGGFGGNAIEKNVRSNVQYRMLVRLDNGSTRSFTQSAPFGYNTGERVRIVNGHVERN